MARIASVCSIFAVLAASTLCGQSQDGGATQKASVLNAQVYVKMLVSRVGNPDPRLRFSIREGLRVMGAQAVSVLAEARIQEKNNHVKAFMDRTIQLIKSRDRVAQGNQRNTRGFMGRFFSSRQPVDIDRIAMEANLTWEQMDKVLPILKKARKESNDLLAVFRESGDFRDREAMRDLTEELKNIASRAAPKLREFLKPDQIRKVRPHLDPIGEMLKRIRRHFGGRGRGERGGPGERERP